MYAGGNGKEKLVVSLLNQSGAYAPYNKAFAQYGVQVHVTEAENVGLMRFSQIPPRNARDRAKGRLLVPADAILGMRFSHLDAKEYRLIPSVFGDVEREAQLIERSILSYDHFENAR